MPGRGASRGRGGARSRAARTARGRRVIQGVEWMRDAVLAVGDGPLDAPLDERPPGTATLAGRVDAEHPEARRSVGSSNSAYGFDESGDVGDATDDRPVTVDRHRDLGDGGPAGDVGQLELVVGFLDVAGQGAVGSEHDGPARSYSSGLTSRTSTRQVSIAVDRSGRRPPQEEARWATRSRRTPTAP